MSVHDRHHLAPKPASESTGKSFPGTGTLALSTPKAGLHRPEGGRMLANQVAAAIDAARSPADLDAVARNLWRYLADGAIDDTEADRLSGLLQARRDRARPKSREGGGEPTSTPAHPRLRSYPPRRLTRTPDRARSIERRRMLAASGPMPPRLAASFTTGELAALRIVADECRDRGFCALPLAAIAARAGIGRTTAQNAIRTAARLGLLEVRERRRPGRASLPNILRVVCREWAAWTSRQARGRRVQKAEPYRHKVRNSGGGNHRRTEQVGNIPAQLRMPQMTTSAPAPQEILSTGQ